MEHLKDYLDYNRARVETEGQQEESSLVLMLQNLALDGEELDAQPEFLASTPSSFKSSAHGQIQDFVKSCRTDWDDLDKNDKIYAEMQEMDYLIDTYKLWMELRTMVELAVRLSQQVPSLPSALELYYQVFHQMLPHLWIEKFSWKEELLVVLDESLLIICKQVNAARGIKGLRLWRARLIGEDLTTISQYGPTVWGGQGFVLRAIQYVSDCCARVTIPMIVGKIAAGRLPQELANLIERYALASRDIPTSEDVNAWAPARLPRKNYFRSLVTQHCCRINRAGSDRSHSTKYFYSVEERRYIRFHGTTGVALRHVANGFEADHRRTSSFIDPSLNTDFDAFEGIEEMFILANGDDDGYDASSFPFNVRCLQFREAGQAVNHKLVERGPFPADEILSGDYYEMDHGIDRNWRVKYEGPPRGIQWWF